MKMAGTVINWLVDLAYALMFMAGIFMVAYIMYLFNARYERNRAQLIENNNKPWIARVLIKIRDLGKKVRER